MKIPSSHTLIAKIFHWGFIILYTYGMVKQLDDLSQLEDAGLLYFEVVFSILFLLIVIFRYLYMRKYKTFFGARKAVSKAHQYLGKTIHISMYLCLVLLPLSGLLIAGLYSFGFKDGILQGIAVGIHEFSASMSYFLIVIHVVGAVYSRIKGEGIWTSMVPFWKEGKPTSHPKVKKLIDWENQLFRKVETYFSLLNKDK
jgi:cytochrome b561|tara:strand:- start:492 stop:1088 length:597 start_codon:yes stop_codon:yes gene_type:complete